MQVLKTIRLNIPAIITGIIFLFIYPDAYALDYGYPVSKDQQCGVWWAEGTYQVFPSDPLPEGNSQPLQIFSAANEYESFQLIIQPYQEMKGFRISVSEPVSADGSSFPSGSVTVRKVEYVHVVRPTDSYGKPGWYPDPLPILKDPLDLESEKNHPFFITVHVPSGTPAAKFNARIHLSADGWESEIPLVISVWNFQLPEFPSIRSAFGLSPAAVDSYHNLNSEKELREVTDLYYQMMSDYGIAPTSPFTLYPMEVMVDGLYWKGGVFTDEDAYSGRKALKIVDDKVETNVEAFTSQLIEVNPSKDYVLSWFTKTAQTEQKYCILLKCYDNEKDLLPFENRLEEFTGGQKWKGDTLKLRPFRDEIRYVSVHLFPVFRTRTGHHTGTAWYDDIVLTARDSGINLIPQGGFEVSPEDLELNVDFTEFDKAGEKYLDGLGFNAYHLPLQGLPSGNFYEQERGVFMGFAQGTEEYDLLMKRYLTIVQDHLEEKGWLGKEYVYWFDEPNEENYSFVREGMEIIHRSAPKITRFITEHRPGPDIMDVSEVSCTVIGQLDPNVISDLVAQGREFWSYVCCCPKAPYLSLFIDHDAVNMRMWLWLSFKFQMKGILVWSSNYWNSATASPPDYLQNPWEDPMSYTTGYGLPFGKQNGWGNGDGRFFYPPNRTPNDHSKKYEEGPVPCLRLEILRDGIEDYEYLLLLQSIIDKKVKATGRQIRTAQKLLPLPDRLVKGPIEYEKDPQALLQYRNEIGELLHEVYSVK